VINHYSAIATTATNTPENLRAFLSKPVKYNRQL